MASSKQRPSLVVIVGPTASGKSALAMKIAKNYDGEIIAADSRTVYKGMDVGTAKPSSSDQKEVPHWGLDLVEPGQRFTVVDFKKYASGKIAEITKRGKLPILVGGSGLYINSILYNYDFEPNDSQNPLNPRHRQADSYSKDTQIIPKVCVIGLLPEDKKLRSSISQRADKMIAQGVVNETNELMLKLGKKSLLSSGGLVYKVCIELIDGKISLGEAKELFKLADWQYVRRQKTWFKRNPHILWFKDSSLAERKIHDLLNT